MATKHYIHEVPGKLATPSGVERRFSFNICLETERGAERVVDERPRHLNHLLQLRGVALVLQALGVLDQTAVRVVHLQVELDGLENWKGGG